MSRTEVIALENHIAIVKGAIGAGAPMLATVLSYLDQIEAWLRIASLIVGIGVGIATIRSLRRKR